ncbi:hypothetical protein FACS189485_16890 [Spirochaetia bacterium]|nr:hypothetical protein FACS189485_16890 [Spirochaetia bacterium]
MEYDFMGQLTFKDYVQFNKIHIKKTFIGKFRIIVYVGLIVFVIISEWSDIKFLWENDPLKLLSVFLLPLIITFGIILLINNFVTPLIYKRHYKSNSTGNEIKHFKITQETISINGDSENRTLTKEKINRILFDKDSIYIYTALTAGHVIKKHYLNNENEFNELVKFIKENYMKTK